MYNMYLNIVFSYDHLSKRKFTIKRFNVILRLMIKKLFFLQFHVTCGTILADLTATINLQRSNFFLYVTSEQ